VTLESLGSNSTVCMRIIVSLFFAFGFVPSSHDEKRAALEAEIANAETVEYCHLLDHHLAYKSKMVRVRALYETDFEESALTAPACPTRISLTWVELQEGWESRTSRRVRRAFNALAKKWGRQADVVFVGTVKGDRSYGHMDMYPFCFDVYKIESARPSGSFKPFPEGKERPVPNPSVNPTAQKAGGGLR
jgi:hypothetical protein